MLHAIIADGSLHMLVLTWLVVATVRLQRSHDRMAERIRRIEYRLRWQPLATRNATHVSHHGRNNTATLPSSERQ